MKEKDNFGGNLFCFECPTLAYYRRAQKVASFEWDPEQEKALPLVPHNSRFSGACSVSGP